MYSLTNKQTSCNSKVILVCIESSCDECILYALTAVYRTVSIHSAVTMASGGDWKFIFWTVINTTWSRCGGLAGSAILAPSTNLLTYLLTYLTACSEETYNRWKIVKFSSPKYAATIAFHNGDTSKLLHITLLSSTDFCSLLNSRMMQSLQNSISALFTYFLPWNSGTRLPSTAASPTAPAPSTTAFSISIRRNIASAINSSLKHVPRHT